MAVTGAIDLVSDGEQCVVIRNGRPEMGLVTGTGCQLSALTAACLAASPERPLEAAAAAVCAMGVAGGRGCPLRTETPPIGIGSLTLCAGWTARRWRKEPTMRCDKKDLLLYGVTDRSWLGDRTLAQQVEASLRGGATMIQLREKHMDRGSILAQALELRELCGRYGVPLILNDDAELAQAAGADGVHVGQSDMEAGRVRALLGEDKLIGVSARTVEQALAAQAAGADYLGVGAMFPTGTKQDTRPVSYDTLKAICAAVDIAGVAVVSALYAQPDVEAATRSLRAQVERVVGP